MKKLIALLLACVMVLGLVACGNTPAETTAPADNAPETTAPAAEGPEAITLKVWAPQEDQVDANSWLMQVEAQFQAAHPEYAITWDNGVCAEGDAKTLIVVVGGSSKGLGAAGIDADGELARLAELIDGAKGAGLSVIAMHTGGEARRGDLSDKFITPIFEKADYAIVVTAGDEDGMMAGICASKGIPMDAIASISEVTTVLPAAFK